MVNAIRRVRFSPPILDYRKSAFIAEFLLASIGERSDITHMVKKTTSVIHLSDNDISNVVIKEREIIDVAFKRVSGSKKKAKAFLVSAGIMSKDGKLTEAYR